MRRKPSFAGLDTALPPELLDIARAVSAELREQGVPHAIIGGLAVGAHGWARMTRDIDVLVPSDVDLDELLVLGERASPLALPETFVGRSAVRAGVEIDVMAPAEGGAMEVLDDAIADAETVDGLPVLALGPLVLMKLVSGRARDDADIVEMLKASKDDIDETADDVASYLEQNSVGLLDDFDSLVAQATWELHRK